METSIFYDFSQGRHCLRWFIQSIIFPTKVWFYYDKKQEAYCRRVENVKGKDYFGVFISEPNFLVNYPQKILNEQKK